MATASEQAQERMVADHEKRLRALEASVRDLTESADEMAAGKPSKDKDPKK